ncbi:MAG: ATP synthase F1 subunit gamma [Deltaproteobacteria bacterium]|nr:ATP synthase F1 subunit gamma [Deltaproteobacteria bacterium]
MPSLRALRKRIGSVRNTRQITKAMKMVAAAKMRRAQEAILKARPYANGLSTVLLDIAARVNTEAHPLLARREPKKVELVVMTSDRGLCGSFNTNIVRRAEQFLFEKGGEFDRISLSCIGRKGRDHFRRKTVDIRREYIGVFNNITFSSAAEIAQELARDFVAQDLDAIWLLYNEFKSVIQQRVALYPLLPMRIPEETGTAAAGVDFVFEPDMATILDAILPKYLGTEIYRAMLESAASEHGARMTAMDNATKAAGEMIDSLTLKYNKARQAAITKELMEIVTGAEAIKA